MITIKVSFFLAENVEKRHLLAYFVGFPISGVHSKKRFCNPKCNPKLCKVVTLNSNPNCNPKSKRTQKKGASRPLVSIHGNNARKLF